MTKVEVFSLVTDNSRKKPYLVRWRVEGRFKQKSFESKAEADADRSLLMLAKKRREAFDLSTGRPVSETQTGPETVASYLRSWMLERWPTWAPGSRSSVIEGLTCAILTQVANGRGKPTDKELRLAVRKVWLRPDAVATSEQQKVLDWLTRNSLPLASVPAELVKQTLTAMATRHDGKQVANATYRRRRQAYNQALQDATVGDHPKLHRNPVSGLRNPIRGGKISKAVKPVRRSIVADPPLARELLALVSLVGKTGERYRAFFAVMYFAGLRPSEVVALQRSDCYLPAEGWGSVTLRGSSPTVGTLWTDDGESVDHRGLKHREPEDGRVVPIPPELVAHVITHLAAFPEVEGRVFSNSRGGLVDATKLGKVWAATRKLKWPKPEEDPGCVPVPYALRHSNASMLLSAGVPVGEVARRLGHTPDVLLKVYAHAMQSDEATANARIDTALAAAAPAA